MQIYNLIVFFVGDILLIFRVDITHYIDEFTAQYNERFLSFRSYACRNAPGTLKVTTSLPSCASTTIVVNNIVDATVSTYFRYLHCLLPSAHVLLLMCPSLLSLIKLNASRFLVILYYSVNNVGSIGWIPCFPGISLFSNWLNYWMMVATDLSPKILMPRFAEILVNITSTALL